VDAAWCKSESTSIDKGDGSDHTSDIKQALEENVRKRKPNAGYFNVTFSASKLPTGVYLYRLISNKCSSVRKHLLVK
jgi:hypothetical protein